MHYLKIFASHSPNTFLWITHITFLRTLFLHHSIAPYRLNEPFCTLDANTSIPPFSANSSKSSLSRPGGICSLAASYSSISHALLLVATSHMLFF